jgi:methylated-DNA-[protein]-cysteine S-methyltransferase
VIETPLGPMSVDVDGEEVIGVDWKSKPAASALQIEAENQLRAYFNKQLNRFDLPIRFGGTAFMREVWTALLEIPYGTTTSYSGIGHAIGAKSARAIGLANGRNPIAIIVPCHRVIGADGSLTGYGGGLDRKLWLLRHEGAVLA